MPKKKGHHAKSDDNVKVVIRCRPLNSKEKEKKFPKCVKVNEKGGTIVVDSIEDPSKPPKKFTFDDVYGENSLQADVYNKSAKPIVDAVLEGYNGTIFAYGQTGTGKTFTMNGEPSADLQGIIPRSFVDIFDHIQQGSGQQYLVRASFLEIYKDDIRDLLSKDHNKRLAIRDSPDKGIYVQDLNSIVVKSVKEIEKVMHVGNKNRKVGVTDMNQHSSRSHAIFIINVECSELGPDGEAHIRSGKLNLVDLAGSERLGKTHAEGERKEEGVQINLSLSALGQVIKALVEGVFVPYRNSSLTRLLQDSLGGNAKTMMIAAIGPASYNYNETIGTLGYANRAKSIKNKPIINEDPKDALLRKYQEEIAALKEQLDNKHSGGKSSRKKKKKKKPKTIKYDSNGQVIEEEESEEEEEEEGEEEYDEEEEKRIRDEELAKLEHDKEVLLADQSMIQEEKTKLLDEMEKKQIEIQEEQRAAADLSAKIAALESRLLIGGKDINEYTAEQAKKLKREQKRLAKEKQKAEDLKRRLEEEHNLRKMAEGKFSSLRDVVSAQTEELKRLWDEQGMVSQQIDELKEWFFEQRDGMTAQTDDLSRQLRLKELIVEHFIPPSDAEKLKKRVYFSERHGRYLLRSATHSEGGEKSVGLTERPKSAFPDRIRPITLFSQIQRNIDENTRYRMENVMTLELDLPERTTEDYVPPSIGAREQEALTGALAEEEDIVMNEPTNDFVSEGLMTAKINRKKMRQQRPGAAKSINKKKRTAQKKKKEEELFPSSRGLVPK
eukprot:m.9574 g.9574  ORF g.9574 m.9574 type:complete len:778 (+) comp3494_c0_seq1:199-2532(+)